MMRFVNTKHLIFESLLELSEIPTKLEKNGQHLLYGAMDEQRRMKNK